MKCNECGTELKEMKTEINSGWGDYRVVIRDVPALVCEKCGNKLFKAQEMEMIEKLSIALSETDEKPEYINLKEAADLLRVSNQTIYNMIGDGRLKAVKCGREWRFMRKNIESLMVPENNFAFAARNGKQVSTKDEDAIKKVMKDLEDK